MAGLPPALEGVRILHLSDFHLGPWSPGQWAFVRAVDWASTRNPDVVAITGDLLSAPRGAALLTRGLAGLPATGVTVAVLGNHDVGVSRDPFSTRASVDLSALGVRLLEDEGLLLDVRGALVQLVGVSPSTYLGRRADPAALADPAAALRVLLCHFPRIVDRADCSAYALVLAGHMHGGQICLPYPGGKLRFAHLRAAYPEGRHRHGASTLVVSRGIGTTFVPLRFFARPEAVELVLTAAPAQASPGTAPSPEG